MQRLQLKSSARIASVVKVSFPEGRAKIGLLVPWLATFLNSKGTAGKAPASLTPCQTSGGRAGIGARTVIWCGWKPVMSPFGPNLTITDGQSISALPE
jgi:hypothetical protein